MGQLVAEFLEEFGVVRIARVGLVELGQRVRQRLGNEGTAVGAEMAARVGELIVGGLEQGVRAALSACFLARFQGCFEYFKLGEPDEETGK